MRKEQIDALVDAHHGRTRPVVFLHILRQDRLEPDDQAFLRAHAGELALPDLLRWRSRCEPGLTLHVIQELARRAIAAPIVFRYEVLEAPRLEFTKEEWRELAELVEGNVPRDVYARLKERAGVTPARPRADTISGPRQLSSKDPDAWAGVELPPLADTTVQAAAALASESATAEEQVSLLYQLERQGISRTTLIPAAVYAIRGRGANLGVVAWLARNLTTRSAWERHGVEIIGAFIERAAFAELADLFTFSLSEAQREDADPADLKVVDAMTTAFATELVAMAQRALDPSAGAAAEPPAERRALAALSALVCLDPPSRLSKSIHQLARLDSPSPAVTDLLKVNQRLVRRASSRAPTFEGLIAAIHVLVDTMSR
ncbi:MAG: hypothetical protein U0271_07045 [Polyangiaceae bacterium]